MTQYVKNLKIFIQYKRYYNQEFNKVMKKLSFLGIIVGGIVDIVATNLFAIPLIVYVIISKDILSLPSTEMQKAMIDAFHNDKILYIINMLIGCACLVLGGYAGARIAKHHELINGALTSFLCVCLSIYSLFTSPIINPIYLVVILFIASPLCALLGGYLRLRQKGQKGVL
jgi:hypothetical protein